MKRTEVLKTYKLFINGEFPRTESGRHIELKDKQKNHIANICKASRKDFRNAVSAALTSQPSWAGRTAYNRSQILYRMAEMAEGRKGQLQKELEFFIPAAKAKTEVEKSIDMMIYYAGFCDKYSALASSVNPVSGPFFNFSVPEPMGIVSVLCPDEPSLLGFVAMVMPAVAGGNTVVALCSEKNPLPVLTLTEIFATSDLPKGVINVLSGERAELASHFATHMEVNALAAASAGDELLKELGLLCADTVKRFIHHEADVWINDAGLYRIMEFQEIKTTWHPIDKAIGTAAKY
ncbi:MAG: aldehyde dehydrogenase family protein [Bacteroidia bacterium]|nr:aldehyde dehydrogenase family protein [Bacteroidia bacterium]